MPTLEELEAELARRKGAASQGPSLEELEAELARRQGAPKPVNRTAKGGLMRMAGGLLDRVTGEKDREFDYPDLGSVDTGLSMGQDAKLALSKTFGSDDDIANRLSQMGVNVQIDAKGEPYARLPSGEVAYLNRPGLDISDILTVVGQGAAYAGGAVTNAARGLATRALGTAAGTAAVDVAAQKAAGREDIDAVQTALAAGLGGATEALAPVVMAAMRRAGDTDPVTMGRAIANELGMEQVDDATARKLAANAEEMARGMTPAAGEAQMRGFTVTRGQKTGDFSQQALEEQLRSTPNSGGQMIRNADDANRVALERNLEELQAGFGGPGAATAEDAATAAGDAIKSKAASMRQATREAYDQVGTAFVEKADIQDLAGSLDTVADFQRAVRNPRTFPNASTAIEELQRQARGLPENVAAVRIDSVEDTRKFLNSLAQTDNKADAMVVRKVIERFDDWQDGLKVSGDPGAVEAYKNARALFALERNTFSPKNAKDVGRKAAGAIADGDLGGREVASLLYADGAQPKAGAARVAKHIIETLGPESEGVKSMREMAFLKMVQNNQQTGYAGQQQIITNLRSIVQGRNKELGKALFTAKQLDELGKFSNALEAITPQGIQAASSGTTERAIRTALDRAKLGQVVDWWNASQALAPLPAPAAAVSPIVPGAVASQASGQ